MSNPFLAEIRIFPFTFAPHGWALCNGQILPISQNTALFSLLGTNFGGDGKSNFGLPNLQGRSPMGTGNANGLSNVVGELGGSSTLTLTAAQMPVHSHQVIASTGAPTSSDPSGTFLAEPLLSGPPLYSSSGPSTPMSSEMGAVGGGQPISISQPFVVFNFCIALQGIFPSRN
jgi:microcystin-dependent protein